MRPDLEWKTVTLMRTMNVGGDRRLVRFMGEQAVIDWGVTDQYGNRVSTRYEVQYPRDGSDSYVCEQFLQRGGVARMRSGSVLGRGESAGAAKCFAEAHTRREGPRIRKRFTTVVADASEGGAHADAR